jgi:hypothetical protein
MADPAVMKIRLIPVDEPINSIYARDMKISNLLTTFALVSTCFTGALAFGSTGLVIHAAEVGVGKFHRHDNQVHAYDATNVWAHFILPDAAGSSGPVVIDNTDGSVTVFFSTLEELLTSAIKASEARGLPISVLNLNGHGLPGTMWFPSTAQAMQSWICEDWRGAASGSDSANYDQYYSGVSPSDIRQIRSISNNPNFKMGCTTGLAEWKAGVAKFPRFKQLLAPDAQIHFLSCVVGLGSVGQAFTQGMAELLLTSGGGGRVETSMNFGLGDWSMPEGMGFWDLQSDAQVERDNALYAKHRKDSEIAQKGTVRVVSATSSGLKAELLGDRDFMALSFESELRGTSVAEHFLFPALDLGFEAMPARIRVPGTKAYVYRVQP